MDFLKHPYADIYLENGILYFRYRLISNFDLLVAQELVSERLRFQREQSFPVLCDIRQVDKSSPEARQYLALEGSLLTTAVAYLVTSHYNERLIRFFIQVNQPPVPSKVFTSEEAALEFLSPFKE